MRQIFHFLVSLKHVGSVSEQIVEVIAASCYAQTGVSSATVDVDLHSKALRGAPGGQMKHLGGL